MLQVNLPLYLRKKVVTQAGSKRRVTVPKLKDMDEVLHNSDRDEDNVVYSQEDTETKGKILKQKNLKR